MQYPNFCAGAFSSRNSTNLDEQCINLFPSPAGSPGAKSQWELIGTPGVSPLLAASLGGTPARASAFVLGRLFYVMGSKIWEMSKAATPGIWQYASRGTVSVTGAEPATISCNGAGGQELFITSGGKPYHIDLATNTLTDLSGLITSTVLQGAMAGGYFFYLDADGVVGASGLLDGSPATGWDALARAERTDASDQWDAIAESGGYLWLLGTETSEVWEDTAQRLFPFTKLPGASVDVGIAARFSVKKVGKSLFWLSRTRDGLGSVVRTNGLSIEPVSPPTLDDTIGTYATVSDAVGDTYAEGGHTFYVLTFPTEGVTWVYDLTTNQWHRRGAWNSDENRYTAWRAAFHVAAFDRNIVFDREGDWIYEMSLAYYADIGDLDIRRVRRAAVLASEQKQIVFHRLELSMRVGVGTVAVPNPTMTLNYSNDGGRTWALAGEASLGAQGQYATRVIYRRLGAARNRSFEIVTSARVPICITGAILNPEGQAS